MTNKITIINQTSEELDCSRLGIYTLKEGDRVYAQTGPASMTKSEAEKQIAAILAQFENDQNVIVKSIGIEVMDISTFAESKYLAQVSIETLRAPGRGWHK